MSVWVIVASNLFGGILTWQRYVCLLLYSLLWVWVFQQWGRWPGKGQCWYHWRFSRNRLNRHLSGKSVVILPSGMCSPALQWRCVLCLIVSSELFCEFVKLFSEPLVSSWYPWHLLAFRGFIGWGWSLLWHFLVLMLSPILKDLTSLVF